MQSGNLPAVSYIKPPKYQNGHPGLPEGQPLGSFSFDQLAGSIVGMFDFDDHPDLEPLFLDPLTGARHPF